MTGYEGGYTVSTGKDNTHHWLHSTAYTYPIRESCKQLHDMCTDDFLKDTARTIIAVDEPDIPNITKNDSDCAGLPKTLRLYKGSRVIQLRNIMATEGLVNG